MTTRDTPAELAAARDETVKDMMRLERLKIRYSAKLTDENVYDWQTARMDDER